MLYYILKNYNQLKMDKIEVYAGNAKYDRYAYLEIDNGIIRFDCSDEEYGPIEFPLELLKEKIKEYEETS